MLQLVGWSNNTFQTYFHLTSFDFAFENLLGLKRKANNIFGGIYSTGPLGW